MGLLVGVGGFVIYFWLIINVDIELCLILEFIFFFWREVEELKEKIVICRRRSLVFYFGIVFSSGEMDDEVYEDVYGG